MAANGHLTGMRGVHLVAAQTVARGLIVSPTARSAFGADLLATNADCSHAFSVQVKTNGKRASFSSVSERARTLAARSHVYVFVNLTAPEDDHEFYVVPSRTVARIARCTKRERSTRHFVPIGGIEQYRSRWRVVGAATKRLHEADE